MNKQKGLFDEDIRLNKIKKQGDPLIRLNELIDWEMFRPDLKKNFKKKSKGPGGRPPYDYILMFKILFLQRFYNLSDAQMEYQILDRLSFMRFLDLQLHDDVPDEKTIWNFREQLKDKIEVLFEKFNEYLMDYGAIAQTGNIIDGSIIEVPKQRNNKEENDKIKNNEEPENWSDNKRAQKDIDARWTKKNGKNFYGYKNHIKIDKKSKLIENYAITDASVHDSAVVEDLLEEDDEHHELYADSAYSGSRIEEILKERKIKNQIHEKGYRNRPLTDKQKARNKIKSKTRVRVEHIFGYMKNSMKLDIIRTIGITRAKVIIGLNNMVYNICRYLQILKLKTA